MNDKIETLLRFKSAGQLDEAERAEVLEEMTLAEYERLHRAIAVLPGLDADAAPPPALRERLLAHGRKNGYLRAPRYNWWKRRIPLWQAAAACMALVVAGYVIYCAKAPVSVEKSIEKIVYQRDTVNKTDTVWLRRTVVRYLRPAPSGPSAEVADTLLPTRPSQAMESPTGTPIGDMPALMEFLGGAHK